jgi:hypothetical protein
MSDATPVFTQDPGSNMAKLNKICTYTELQKEGKSKCYTVNYNPFCFLFYHILYVFAFKIPINSCGICVY